MSKSETFKKAINHLRMVNQVNTDKDVAIKMGADPSNISRGLKGKPEPTDKFLKRFNDAFGNIFNETWLLTGKGEMLNPSSSRKVEPKDLEGITSNAMMSEEVTEVEYAGENKNAGVFFRDQKGQLYISVPHMPYAARGEFPNLADSLEPLSSWGREVYAVDRKAGGRYVSFDIRGDSMDNGMYGCLRNGDKVLVRELEHDNWRTLRTGDHRFWVLVFGSSVLIKEISAFDPQSGIVTCHSLNPSPEYHDFDVQLDEVRHLYYVIRIKPHEIPCV